MRLYKNDYFYTDGRELEVSDIDNDGDLDAVYRTLNTLEAAINHGGQFQSRRTLVEFDRPISWFDLQDIDNDGDIDITLSGDEKLDWIENVGGGEFSPDEQTLISEGWSQVEFIAMGDMDQDGHVDIVYAKGGGIIRGSQIFFASNSNEQFRPKLIGSDPNRIDFFDLVDVDADGDIDVLTTTRGRNSHSFQTVWYENHQARFSFAKRIDAFRRHHYHKNAFGDLNGNDGHDVVTRNSINILIWQDLISGRSGRLETDRPNEQFNVSAIVDIDQDGDQDVIAHGQQRIVWFENQNGHGDFSSAKEINHLQTGFRSIRVADFDLDGDLDLLAMMRCGKLIGYDTRISGDVNDDGVFNSTDLVRAFQRGEYEDGIYRNSTFASGDWNDDGEFDSADLVFIFQAGVYMDQPN